MAMIWKFKAFYSHERELAFLEEMNKKGYRLDKVVGGNLYRFERVEEEHFTISRIVPGKNARDLIAMAKEKGYSCCLQKTPLGLSILYLDGTRGVSDETFLSGEEDLNVHRLGLRKFYGGGFAYHAVLLGLLLVALTALQVAAVIKFILPWAEHGVLSLDSMDVFWEYGCVSVFGMLITIGFLPPMMTFFRLWRGREKPKNWKGRVLLAQGLCCLLLVPVILVACIPKEVTDEDEPTTEESGELPTLDLEFKSYVPSTEKLGERYYLYAEYESDLLFADVKPLLEAKGYTFRDTSHLLEESGDTYYYTAVKDAVVGEKTERVGIFILECETEERAKQVYNRVMAQDISHIFAVSPWSSRGVVRMGRMLYGTLYSEQGLKDLLDVYGLPLPEASPLYKGGAYQHEGDFAFEQVVAAAKKAGYTFYDYDESWDNSIYERALDTCHCLVSEDHRGYLLVGKLDRLVAEYITQLFRITHDDRGHESMKYVMLSEDTFIAGTSYYVDTFIAELERSTTFEAYAPSAEKIGEQYCLYEEYESDLLLEDVKPFFEERGYDIRDLSKRLDHREDTCYYSAKNEETGVHVVMMECKTEERAKKVFEQIMARDRSHVFLAEPWDSSVVVRVGRTIFGTLYGDQGVQDIFEACNLTLPTPVPLYKGGLYTYGETVTFERALEEAKKEKYELGGRGAKFFESTENLPFERVRYIVTPDHKGFLCIGQLARLWAENLPEKLYVSLDEQGKEAMKYVMLSGGTFIAGTSYYVDAFIAELEE